MDLSALCEAVAAAPVVHAVGARTQWEVANAPAPGADVRAPVGLDRYEPADMTITVGAGTTVADLDATLAEQRQQCPLEQRVPWTLWRYADPADGEYRSSVEVPLTEGLRSIPTFDR